MSVYRLQSSVVRLGLAYSSRQPFRARSSGNGGSRLQLTNRQDLHKAKRIVVKLGSNVVTGQHTDTLAIGKIGALVEQVREDVRVSVTGLSKGSRWSFAYRPRYRQRGLLDPNEQSSQNMPRF